MANHDRAPVIVKQGSSGLGLLTVLFIGLKLTGFIGWSWWWVLAPMWGPLALGASVWLLFAAFFVIVAVIQWRNERG